MRMIYKNSKTAKHIVYCRVCPVYERFFGQVARLERWLQGWFDFGDLGGATLIDTVEQQLS